MGRIRCFIIEAAENYTPLIGVYEDGDCPLDKSTGKKSHSVRLHLDARLVVGNRPECPDLDDPSLPWPTHCACGYEFTDAAHHYSGADRKYRRADGEGGEFDLRNTPPGALWRTPIYEDSQAWRGLDGQSWWCMTPGGVWHIDGRASNCTMKDDNVHKCWVRHGVAPDFHVDKNGNTCAAGAGSILAGSYHGFLRHGYLESC